MNRTRTSRRHLAYRLTVASLCVLALVTTALAASLLAVRHKVEGQVGRVDSVFTGLQHRPGKPTTGTAAEALDILVLGTDRRSEVPTTGRAGRAPTWVPGAQRSDTMMLVHVSGDRSHVTAVSLPRDSWVDVPGHGPAKLNAAFSYAGPSLAVATVEDLTGIRVDHLLVVDMEGLAALVDVLGGADVTVPETVRDPMHRVTWTRGDHHLDGRRTVLFARHRYGLPRGDLDRIERQHQVVRSLAGSVRTAASDFDVRRLARLLDAFTSHVSVDAGWDVDDMLRLVLDLRHLRDGGMRLMTVPVADTGWEGDQSVVHLDHAAGQRLWADLRADRVPD